MVVVDMVSEGNIECSGGTVVLVGHRDGIMVVMIVVKVGRCNALYDYCLFLKGSRIRWYSSS